MTFTEASTVEAMLCDIMCGGITHHTAAGAGLARRNKQLSGLGWHYIDPQHIPRHTNQVLVEDWLRESLARLNPEIEANPDFAEEVLYKLRAIILSVASDGLIRSNEEFTAWLRGERSMPFGENNEHTSVKLIDFDNLENNHYVITSQFVMQYGPNNRRADLVLLVNGIPLVLIEAKTPVRKSVSWLDGAIQVQDYEKHVPALFTPNVFSVACDGKDLRYGSIRMPVDKWGPWRIEEEMKVLMLREIEREATSLLRPGVILDILQNFMRRFVFKTLSVEV